VRTRSRTVEHVGEWKVALLAATREALFAEVARLIARTGGSPSDAKGAWEPVVLVARDAGTLLVDWANELIGRSEVADRAYADVRHLRIVARRDGAVELSAEVYGRPVRAWASPLKAATYHALVVERRGEGWHAELLFDV
jgi:SHS2 domain-containing protein